MNVQENLRGDRDEDSLASFNADWLVMMSQVNELTKKASANGFKMTMGGEYWVWDNWNMGRAHFG